MAFLAVAGQVLASAVLDLLLERAITATANELRLVRGVPEEIGKLHSTLIMIRCLVKDAEKRSVGETPVGEWLRLLKQLFLDADDLLDEYATDAARQSADTKVRPMKFACFSCIRGTTTASAMAHQIRKINKRLDDLASMKDKLGLQVSIPGENSRLEPMRRDPTSSVLADEHSVIGRDSERERIVKLLLSSAPVAVSNNRRSLSVLPIVGMGGMGKTTLAKLVFNDKKMVEHFELRIWVCVSNDFDLIRLTKDMIDGAYASGGKNELCQVTQWDVMQQKLRGELEGRTFLLVLDDVWEANWSQWEKLFEPLKFASRGSKIVITTRNRDVVDKIQGRMDPIRLEGLSDSDIWSLFKGYAFHGVTNADGTINAEYYHLEAMGRNIVRRLKGSPLAARTIGSLLSEGLDAQHWKRILNSDIWTLEHEPDDILPTLGLSYQYLRGDLKQCFAYLSLFPKGHEFVKQELVQLWNAQCFIRMETGKSIETTGGKYINNLLQRSFLDPAPSSFHPCVMHDLIHDLAEFVSKDDCFRLEDQRCTEIPATVRHISLFVTKFDPERMKELCKHVKLRTLLFLTRNNFNGLTTHDLDELFLKLKRLRVLRLSDCGIKELPSSIGEMKHLRYLDLSHNPSLKCLPESLGNLRNLQVLNLSNCDPTLPSRMSELINLRHLIAHESLISKIDGLGKLTALQDLRVEGKKVRELGGMGMLRKLNINRLQDVGKEDAMEARLESKDHLQKLTLRWTFPRDPSEIDREVEEAALQALRPADTITYLSIYDYQGTKLWWVSDDDAAGRPLVFSCLRSLDIQDCPKLSELSSLPPTLTRLHLVNVGLTSLPGLRGCGHDTGGDRGETSSAFGALSQLWISDCPKLTSLRGLLRHHLTVLERLIIRLCRKLVILPEMGFGHMVSLKKLEIFDCDKLTCPSLEDAEGVPLPLPLPLPRTLQTLEIQRCGDAMGGWWWAGLRHLASLTNLTLGECPNTVASFFLSLGRHHNHHLAATLTNLQILNCPFEDGSSSPSASSSSRPAALPPPLIEDATKVGFRALTSLKHLDLRGSLSVLRKWGLGGLPSSLRSFTVGRDDDLNDECLFECLQNLTSLEDLSIVDATNLCSLPSIFGCVTSLQSLTIDRCRNLQSLPDMECLQLKKLAIRQCTNLLSLPASLNRLCSLEELDIDRCAQIESMPEAGLPASLRRLKITECPSLAARCRDQECPDWPKIRHIPDVRIDYKSISMY